MTRKVAPHDLDLQRQVLAAAMAGLGDAARIAPQIDPSHFYGSAHQTVWSHIAKLVADGFEPEVTLVRARLERAGELDLAGGDQELAEIVATTPVPSNVDAYVAELRALAWRRQGQAAAVEAAKAFLDGDDPGPALARLAELHAEPVHAPAPTTSLTIEDLAAVAGDVDAAPDPGWLARPIWPADAHGVIGAESKAGKTWALLDLAVAKATGGAWLGHWPVDRAGPVLLFLGEGGRRKMLRRLRAVGEFYGVTVEDLPIRVCFRAPQLTAAEHRALIAAELDTHHAEMVGLDPLYLAARGANGASLYEMGAHLEDVQATTQRHGAALVVVHHWNQTGTGKGRDRFSGAGPAEWGRVTMSLAVEDRRTEADGRRTVVTLAAEIVGDETADTTARFVRRVEADDPDDLRSPMRYTVEADDAPRASTSEWHGPTECMAAILQFFTERPRVELSKTAMRSQMRALGLSYRNTTVDEALERLALDGHLTVRSGPRGGRYFRLRQEVTHDEF